MFAVLPFSLLSWFETQCELEEFFTNFLKVSLNEELMLITEEILGSSFRLCSLCAALGERGGAVQTQTNWSISPVASFRGIAIGSDKAVLPQIENFEVWIHDPTLQGFVGYLLINFDATVFGHCDVLLWL